MNSVRKPYNEDAGYIACLRSAAGRGFVVIYEAKEQGIDVGGMRYAVVCKAHGSIIGDTSLPRARLSMKEPSQFCEECDNVFVPTCHTCNGQGVYMESCSGDDCPAACAGHEVACEHCSGTGVTQ